jgi:outer membrane murein-binding lipoprotein Lpp
MAKHTRFLLWILAGAVLVTIGASLYELDRRGQSQFEDLASRVDELNANLRVLSRDLRGEMAARNAALRNDMRKEMNVSDGEMIKLRSELAAKK